MYLPRRGHVSFQQPPRQTAYVYILLSLFVLIVASSDTDNAVNPVKNPKMMTLKARMFVATPVTQVRVYQPRAAVLRIDVSTIHLWTEFECPKRTNPRGLSDLAIPNLGHCPRGILGNSRELSGILLAHAAPTDTDPISSSVLRSCGRSPRRPARRPPRSPRPWPRPLPTTSPSSSGTRRWST